MSGAPARAGIVIDELVDTCAQVTRGQDVLLLAHLDGLHGASENLVEQRVIDWIHSAVVARGARCSVLWIDEHQNGIEPWSIPPVMKAAIEAADVVISHSFDFNVEDVLELRHSMRAGELVFVRNFATTTAMLTSDWAYTPYDLVAEIRSRTGARFTVGSPWTLEHENGTFLEGVVAWGMPGEPRSSYEGDRRSGPYRPFPDWVIPPMLHGDINGVFICDRGYSWWTRWIGIPPQFENEVRIEVENNVMTSITGGREAERIVSFLREHIEPQMGENTWMFTRMHPGIHPNGRVSELECPSALHRRMIDQGSSSVVHMHIGHGLHAHESNDYCFGLHITGDIEGATWTVGGEVVIDRGYNTLFDDPDILALAASYEGRPGLGRQYWRG